MSKTGLKYFPYNVFQAIFIYHFLLDLDKEPPSYGFASRVLGMKRHDLMNDARRVEALGLGRIHKAGRPYSIAWLEMNENGAKIYGEVMEGMPLALLTDVSLPPSKFIMDTVPDLEVEVLTRIDYFRMLDEIRAVTGTRHRSYSALSPRRTARDSEAPTTIGVIDR